MSKIIYIRACILLEMLSMMTSLDKEKLMQEIENSIK